MTDMAYGTTTYWDISVPKDYMPVEYVPDVRQDIRVGFSETVGLTIVEIELRNGDEEAVILHFDDGRALRITDSDQDCCEERYLRTDDEIDRFLPSQFIGIQIKEAQVLVENREMSDVHEVVFVDVLTTKGPITFSAHNVHNGYYGGFTVCCEVNNKVRS